MVASAVIGGATLLGASIASRSNNRAVQAQTQAADQSNQLQLQIYQDQQRRLEPFRQFSMSAMGPLAELMGLNYQPGPIQGQPRSFGIGGAGNNPLAPEGTIEGLYSANPMFMGGREVDSRDVARRPGLPLPYDTVPRDPGIGVRPVAPPEQVPVTTPPTPPTPTQPSGNSQLDALRQSPGYQFRLQEGIGARDASAASRGLLLSGAQQRAIERYGQDFASNEYGNRIAQLSAVLSGGQYANNALSQAGQNYAGAVQQSNAAAANARASGYQQNAALFNQALGTGVGLWGQATNWNFGFGTPRSPSPTSVHSGGWGGN